GDLAREQLTGHGIGADAFDGAVDLGALGVATRIAEGGHQASAPAAVAAERRDAGSGSTPSPQPWALASCVVLPPASMQSSPTRGEGVFVQAWSTDRSHVPRGNAVGDALRRSDDERPHWGSHAGAWEPSAKAVCGPDL